MAKTASEIADYVINKMAASQRALGLNKKAYDYVDEPTQAALQEYNKQRLQEAGSILGTGGGALGGGMAGAGLGALLAKKGLRLRGAGVGGALLGLGGGILGGLAGPSWGASQAPRVTASDVEMLNQLAQLQREEGGLGLAPGQKVHGDIVQQPGQAPSLDLYPYEEY